MVCMAGAWCPEGDSDIGVLEKGSGDGRRESGVPLRWVVIVEVGLSGGMDGFNNSLTGIDSLVSKMVWISVCSGHEVEMVCRLLSLGRRS